MKIAIGCCMHESNTFTKLKTRIDDFVIADGFDYRRLPRFEKSSIMGIDDVLAENGVDIVPTFVARALPSGMVEDSAFEFIKASILQKIEMAGIPDGICLALHGSMSVDGIDDPEGVLLRDIRRIVGMEIPIVCALDMHATFTENMRKYANGFAVYRTAPHIDEYETGEKAAQMLLGAVENNLKIKTVFAKIPFLISGEQSETRINPAKALFDSLSEHDKEDGVICTSFVMGFPWADSPNGGAGALVSGLCRKEEMLKKTACKMAQSFWNKRFEFTYSSETYDVKEALNVALKSSEFPVIISDAGDNPTAGASQDTTTVLREMVGMAMTKALFAVIADEKADAFLRRHKNGDRVTLRFGGVVDDNEAIEACCVIIHAATIGECHYHMIRVGGIDVVISDRRCEVYDPEVLRQLGIDFGAYEIMVVKSGYLSPEYLAMARRNILALSPGDTGLVIENLPYKKTPRPIFPLDKEMHAAWAARGA